MTGDIYLWWSQNKSGVDDWHLSNLEFSIEKFGTVWCPDKECWVYWGMKSICGKVRGVMARCSSVGPFWTQPVPWLLFSNTPFLKNAENSHTSRLVSWRPPSDLRGESKDDSITWNRFLRYRWKIITLESAVSVFAGFYTRVYLQVVSALCNHPFISVSKQFLWRKF